MNALGAGLLLPDWPAPARVAACVTTRAGGVSTGPYAGLNLGDHVGDDPHAVASNREWLSALYGIRPAWLKQVHGVAVAQASPGTPVEADASWSSTPGIACAVMTADCLPVLFCDRAGTRVAAAHAGWRGLANGVLEATVAHLARPPEQLLAWLGPAIGPRQFEVGAEVRSAFLVRHAEAEAAFVPGQATGVPGQTKFIADIYALARIRLASVGVTAVYGGGLCTIEDTRFYSYRRANITGRFASLVWLSP
ncbi:peptidoglycan editing factor PgeF [Pseudomonas typographi]|uniref:Purine nucleoside phosphorylase n=1 Tax=Pseudomonas typographi TaxID=2715964 RepID=A0ABR7YXQ0_9PSED|nr:peptidoglycan editing factor PgeF [Pseudomonas typographi]MBD1597953.1 peptidoglycan editing factor PgeF [Pseudomonas typographi]